MRSVFNETLRLYSYRRNDTIQQSKYKLLKSLVCVDRKTQNECVEEVVHRSEQKINKYTLYTPHINK